jgi:hypothetical protein
VETRSWNKYAEALRRFRGIDNAELALLKGYDCPVSSVLRSISLIMFSNAMPGSEMPLSSITFLNSGKDRDFELSDRTEASAQSAITSISSDFGKTIKWLLPS